ncbi:hypothetical protein METEAL_15460 [Mesoterricola silvestris]|uniref:Uncharacterized protein n=1 Tax=Mesoterricola silvestris TaxID=2927979 RepID=A0AA48GJC3_9BACT|nr:hypothetical protein METEAL_15460 [Mesoterricola silvestris]
MTLCSEKKGYPSKGIADRVITKWIRENRTLDLRSYPCRQCGLWHLTHQPDRFAEEIEEAS